MLKVKLAALLLAAASIGCVRPAAAVEEVMPGALYAFHTVASGACPALDWQAYVDGDRSVTGFFGWDRMRHTAKIIGTLATDDSFRLSAKEVDGPRTATVTGKVATGWLTISIDGTGTGCDKKTWKVQRTSNVAANVG